MGKSIVTAPPKKTKPDGKGRPYRTVDWRVVDELCAIQCTQSEILAVLKIADDTLSDACQREHGITFPEYRRQKSEGGRVSLRRWQFKSAKQLNTAMLIWLGKQVLNQMEKKPEEDDPDEIAARIRAAVKEAADSVLEGEDES